MTYRYEHLNHITTIYTLLINISVFVPAASVRDWSGILCEHGGKRKAESGNREAETICEVHLEREKI